ncbi:MAG TPA: hypothetical protein VGM92_02730 [Candidatus Kapabacteria bacterium]|jgi:hypothetical protein
MNKFSWFPQPLAKDVSAKVASAALITYLLMILLVKLFVPIFYGNAVSHAAIFHSEMVMMPAVLLGVGMLSAEASSIPWKHIVIRSIANALIAAVASIALIPGN